MKAAILFACITTTAFAAPGTLNLWRIIGGETAADKQFPHQVAVHHKNSFQCAGSILDETTILTAADCVDGYEAENITVTAGSNKLDQHTQKYQVESFVAHEGFDIWDNIHDIAILKLADRIEWSDAIQPIKLRQTDIDEEDVILAGWGSTYYGRKSNELQFIRLQTITVDECAKRQIFPTWPTEVCTLPKYGLGICHDDWGGALLDQNGEQVGIASWTVPCAKGYSDVFTRVYSYLDWIESNRDFQIGN